MGRLLTATMGKIATLLGFDGANFHAVKVDTDGKLQVDVLTTGLPTGAATAANQTTLLGKITDQLPSYLGMLAERTVATISGAGGYIVSGAVPAGEVWHVTIMQAADNTSASTRTRWILSHNAVLLVVGEEHSALPRYQAAFWYGDLWLEPGDVMRVYYEGALAGDSCEVVLLGYRMTLAS